MGVTDVKKAAGRLRSACVDRVAKPGHRCLGDGGEYQPGIVDTSSPFLRQPGGGGRRAQFAPCFEWNALAPNPACVPTNIGCSDLFTT